MKLKAHAKINIGLRVTGRRSDGYHTIETLFQEIGLADEVELTVEPGEGIFVISSGEDVPQSEENICYKAAELMTGESKEANRITISLTKRIPVGAGLGGGSSDAAAVIRGLNELLELGFDEPTMENMATDVGADVSFFIGGGCQYGEGIGDELTAGYFKGSPQMLLAVPGVKIDTGWAYRELGRLSLTTEREGLKFSGFDYEQRKRNLGLFVNDFERLIFEKYPEIEEIKDIFLRSGAKFASLSGSGSAVYGFFDTEEDAGRAQKLLNPQLRSWVTQIFEREEAALTALKDIGA